MSVGVNRNKRVVLVSFSELPTLQRYLYLLREELEKMGVEAWTVGSSNVSIDAKRGIRSVFVDTPDSPKPSVSSLLGMGRSIPEAAERIRRIDPAAVHFVNKHTWNYFLIRELRKRLPAAKVFHTFHDPVGHEGDAVQRGVVLYHKAVEGMLDGIVVHSDVAERQVRERLKPGCPVFQAPLGVTEWRGYDPPRGMGRALVFGRINPYKGVGHYPAILESLHSIDPGIEVVVAGKAAPEVGAGLLDEIAQAPNCSLRNGFVAESDIDGLFAETDVVLVPYTSVTQSGVVLDAYSRSRAVVCFDIPGIAQYVPDPSLRVPAFDDAGFAERVARLLGDRDALAAASRRCWEYGRAHFTPHAMAASVSEAYREVCGNDRFPNGDGFQGGGVSS